MVICPPETVESTELRVPSTCIENPGSPAVFMFTDSRSVPRMVVLPPFSISIVIEATVTEVDENPVSPIQTSPAPASKEKVWDEPFRLITSSPMWAPSPK